MPLDAILGIRLSVRTLEHMNRQMGAAVEGFQESLRPPPREEEGSILVVTEDGKGVPMRRDASEHPAGDRKRRSKGEKANKKREACVGACRHLAKDRMEGTGMRWRVPGAQPVLHLRATWLNGDWNTFQTHRHKDEERRLYPYRRVVQQRRKAAAWPAERELRPHDFVVVPEVLRPLTGFDRIEPQA